jgi:tRNA modification GTPase
LSRFYEKEDIIDEGLILKFNGPNSYTGEDTIELNCHGSPLILQKTLQSLISLGARMAAPGEFTFRAFINGKLDLAQAEAVADVINAESEKGLSNALKHLKGGFSKSIQTDVPVKPKCPAVAFEHPFPASVSCGFKTRSNPR